MYGGPIKMPDIFFTTCARTSFLPPHFSELMTHGPAVTALTLIGHNNFHWTAIYNKRQQGLAGLRKNTPKKKTLRLRKEKVGSLGGKIKQPLSGGTDLSVPFDKR